MHFKIAGYSALGNRAENEDNFAYEQTGPEQLYAVVCDGLGSHGGGRAASRIAVEQLLLMRPTQLPTGAPRPAAGWRKAIRRSCSAETVPGI